MRLEAPRTALRHRVQRRPNGRRRCGRCTVVGDADVRRERPAALGRPRRLFLERDLGGRPRGRRVIALRRLPAEAAGVAARRARGAARERDARRDPRRARRARGRDGRGHGALRGLGGRPRRLAPLRARRPCRPRPRRRSSCSPTAPTSIRARSTGSSSRGAPTAATSSPRPTAGPPASGAAGPRRPGPIVPDEGARGLEARLVACDDLTPPGDVDVRR